MSFENLKVNDIITQEAKTLGRNDTLDIIEDVMAFGARVSNTDSEDDAERKTQ